MPVDLLSINHMAPWIPQKCWQVPPEWCPNEEAEAETEEGETDVNYKAFDARFGKLDEICEFAAEPESISVDWLKLKSHITWIVVLLFNVKATVCEVVVYETSMCMHCIHIQMSLTVYIHVLYR